MLLYNWKTRIIQTDKPIQKNSNNRNKLLKNLMKKYMSLKMELQLIHQLSKMNLKLNYIKNK